MIHVLCTGGLGNQMFQYAFLKHLRNQGRDACLDTSYFIHNDAHAGYALESAFGIEGSQESDHFTTLWKARFSLMDRLGKQRLGNVFMESSNKEIDEATIPSHAVLYGFWQGEEFFSDVKDEVRHAFTFHNISKRTEDVAQAMVASESIAVHVRRGDYLKNPQYVSLCDTLYYNKAIAVAKSYLPNAQLYVFSDDVKWCQNSSLFGEEAVYVNYNDAAHAYEDMYLISQANIAIIANSSFSWWGGYLGNHDIVIRPSRYKSSWTDEQDKKLYPQQWISGEQ